MKLNDRDLPFAIGTAHAHHRVERREGDAHVARMRGDALFALAENGVNAVVTIECSATAAWFPFVTCRKRRIVKIIATRSLHQIPADGCHVAQLRARPGKECLS